MERRRSAWIFEYTLEIATIILAAATIWLALENHRMAAETHSMVVETHQMALDSKEASATQLGVQTWLEIQQRFDSDEMKRARRMLAKQLTPQYDPARFDEIDTTVLDAFDDIGALFSRGLIDRDLVGGQLGFYVDRWWIACKPYVNDVRKRNMSEDWFSGFESLGKVMAQNDPHLSDVDVKRFLADESHLVTYDQTKQ
ncbi:MAG TPA: hypothetical protein VMP11_03950 [Verrucomicrobiae bacterium]|nr:hypothetical protein [Verrucomicrobiae bacterium]